MRVIRQFFRLLRNTLFHREQRTGSILVKPHRVSTPLMPSVSVDAGIWLDQARTCSGIGEWKRARDCATKAIEINPTLVEAYEIRAVAFRVMGELDCAIKDYSSVVEIDPQQGDAWMFRGACKTQKASRHGRHEAINILNDAHSDYKRACELMPDNERAAGALLELEICASKYREAVGTAGSWWHRVRTVDDKLVFAWLGGIAFILAGKPSQKWVHFQDFLESEPAKLNPRDWSLAEMNGKIAELSKMVSEGRIEEQRLSEVRNVHRLFLSHFSGDGPVIQQ